MNIPTYIDENEFQKIEESGIWELLENLVGCVNFYMKVWGQEIEKYGFCWAACC